MAAPSFVRRPTFWQILAGEFRRTRRPSVDFSEARRWAKLQAQAIRIGLRARTDPVSRLEQELRRFQTEEFRLEQVTALRQINHLLPLVERELTTLDRRRAARAADLLGRARHLPDPESLRRLPPARRN